MLDANRLPWVDALRLTAGLSMVGLHATADPNGLPWSDASPAERVAPVLLRTVLYVARTELFIIISVFLLILSLEKRPRGYRATVQEQAQRLLVPFVFWTLVYAAYGLIKAEHFGYLDTALHALATPSAWIGFLLLGDVKYHMHFIPTLFGVLLFFPLFVTATRFPVLGFGVVVCLVAKSQIDAFLYATFWDQEVLSYLVRAAKILTYVGYGLVAGASVALLRSVPAQTLRAWAAPVAFFGALLCLLKLIGSYKTIVTGAYPYTYTAGYWADFLMPVLLFLLCMCLGKNKWPGQFATLAAYSFGIYLTHPVFLDLVEIAIHGHDLPPIVQIIFKIAIVIPTTCLFVVMLRRVPWLSWTIGFGQFPNSNLKAKGARSEL